MLNIGSIAFDQKDYRLALEYFLKLNNSPLIIDQTYRRTAVLINLGTTYYRLEKYGLAEKFTREGLIMAQKNNYLNFEKNGNETMALISASKNDFRQAFYYNLEAQKLKERVLSDDIKKKVAEATYNIALKQKDNDNLMLKKNIEIGEQTIQIQRIYIFSASGILFLVAILLTVIKRNNRRLLALNHQLDMKNNELKKVSNHLTLATRAGGVGIWDYDIVNNILLWDDQMLVFYGIDKNNFNGTYEAWQEGLHPDDLARVDQEVQMAISGKKELNTEFRILWHDGTIRYIRAHAIVQRDDSGKPFRMIGTNWDITARKQAEETLKNREEQFRTLFENAPVGIFHSNWDGRFLTTNPSLAKMLGYSGPEELILAITNMTTQIYDDPAIRPQIMDALRKTDGWVHYDDVKWKLKDNSIINVDMTGRKVLDAKGNFAYLEGFIENITERRHSEEEIKLYNEELQTQTGLFPKYCHPIPLFLPTRR